MLCLPHPFSLFIPPSRPRSYRNPHCTFILNPLLKTKDVPGSEGHKSEAGVPRSVVLEVDLSAHHHVVLTGQELSQGDLLWHATSRRGAGQVLFGPGPI